MKFLLTITCLLIAAVPTLAGDDRWKPIDPAQLAMKAPTVEKDADAEVIFWEVLVDLSSKHAVFSNYIRIKIFSERGTDSQSKVDLLYSSKNSIEDIAGRTIKADGTIVELKNDVIFDRTIIKGNSLKLKVKSFALPAVEAGAIIEYRWREVRGDDFFLRLPFQRDIPIQSIKYSLKVQSALFSRLVIKTFHGENTPFLWEKENLYSRSMMNVPGFHEEPDMPPDDQVRIWVLMYFRPDIFGSEINKLRYDAFAASTKLTDELRKAAATIVGDATFPEQKIERLFEFCRSKIKRIDGEASQLTNLDRAKFKANKTATDTLRNATGTGADVNLLFAALAIAAGFDARLAMTADRNDIFFAPRSADPFLRLYFMRNSNIAIKLSIGWHFFDPASTFVPYGMLRWQEEGQDALLTGSGLEEFEGTPLSSPEKSLQHRTAKLRLSEDGALEGEVRIEYNGHFAAEKKAYYADKSPEQCEQTLRYEIQQRMSTAELSNIHIENVSDPVKPLVYSFHVRVADYAQRTGKRLFFQPAFFQYGVSPRYSTTERKHEIYFHYPWAEEDQVEIDLPSGFALDHAESLGSFPLSNIGKYEVKIGITKDQRTLVYKRNYLFGIDGRILFPPAAYEQIKRVLDITHEFDSHLITLRQGAKNP